MKNTNPISKLLVSIALLLSFIGFTTTASAGPQNRGYDKMERHQKGEPRMNMKRVMRELSKVDLTDEQRTEIKALIKNGMEANQPKRQQIRTLHMQMQTLRKAETLDEQAVRDISTQIAGIKSDLLVAQHKNRQAINALLTDEQRQKLKEMKAKRKEKGRKNKEQN